MVGPRPKRKPTGTPKRRSAASEEQAGRVEQKPTGSRIANDAGVGTGKARRLDAVAFERNKEPDGGAVSASYRLEIENVLSGRRQNDPVASARAQQCSPQRMLRHSSKIPERDRFSAAPASYIRCSRVFAIVRLTLTECQIKGDQRQYGVDRVHRKVNRGEEIGSNIIGYRLDSSRSGA